MSAWFLLARLAFGVPTPSEMVLDVSGPLIPVHLFGILIAIAFGYTPLKIIGFTSVIIGQLVVGGLVGAIATHQRRPRLVIGLATLVLLILTGAALSSVAQTNYHGLPSGAARAQTLAALAIGYLLFFAVTIWTWPSTAHPAADRDRARFLRSGVALFAAIVGGGAWAALFTRSVFGYDGMMYRGADVKTVTPTDRFYVVTKNVIDPNVDRTMWQLDVRSMHGTQSYTFDHLTQMPFVDQETTLMCINNDIDGGLMSNARWRGVRMRDLIGANVDRSVRRVALHATDNYIDTIPIAKALEPTTIVAYLMNDQLLPNRHGFPVRAIVPGLFGEKNVKWLTGITLETTELKGFYERQGWGPTFTIPTHARFDVPDFSKPLASGTITLQGVAFAGDRGVSRVEVSDDNGVSWSDATLLTPYNPLTWRLWMHAWRARRVGTYQLVVRATDAQGNVQTATRRGAETEGVTGRNVVTAHVV